MALSGHFISGVDSKHNILIEKLDEFIRRYYKNQLLKGSIYSLALLLGSYLLVVLLEYFGEFSIGTRTILFFSFLGLAIFILVRFIFIPLLKLNRIGEIISYEQAAAIIGSHFSNVQDKLLNALQLQNSKVLSGSEDLLLAGINQKMEELRPVPFVAAIDFGENRRHLRYLVPLFLLAGTLAFIWPHILRKGTARLMNYSTYYEKEMPFSFHIMNPKLSGIQTSDYELDLQMEGAEIPAEVFVIVNGVEYKADKKSKVKFSHTFTNLQSSFDFQLAAAGFTSKPYHLEVLPKPGLLQFRLQLTYPAYLSKKDELITNTGDLQVPEGTRVKWIFYTRNTDQLRLRFTDSTAVPEKRSENEFVFSRRFTRDNQYAVLASNHFVNKPDSANYSVAIIPDQYPAIDVTENADSLNPRNVYFSGNIRDDYGFSQLQFVYKLYTTDSAGNKTESASQLPLGLIKNQTSQSFYHFLDLEQFTFSAGDRIEYFFEVRDNDGVNGPKMSRSRVMSFKAPDLSEIRDQREKNNAAIEKDLEESIKKTKQLQKDINDLSRKINDKKQLDYEEKKKLEDLLKKQQELQNKIDQVKQNNAQNNKQQSEFTQMDESILEKQKELEKLFDNVMTPEMKKLFEELNKMLDKLDKNQVQEKLEELKLSNKDIEKELDRNLEAFRQLEVSQKMQDAVDKLDELSKKQEELSRETGDKKQDKAEKADKADKADQKGDNKKDNDQNAKNEQAKGADEKNDQKNTEQKQQELNKQFEELRKDLQELKDKNKALEEPMKVPDMDQKAQEVARNMQNSSQQLQKKQKKEASKSQQEASDKMEQMKDELEQAMQENEQESEAENMQTLRQILENLLNLSFAQEELARELPKTRVDNPQFVNIPKKQNKLRDDAKIIEDSLLALSKRAPEIQADVNREISAIKMNMEKTVKALADRNTSEGTMRMQSTMTSVNNLALLLNENLENMQNQMKSKKEGSPGKAGKCKKPGSGNGQKPSPKSGSGATMRQLQQQLNKQLQDLKDALEKGQKPGNKPGEKNGQKQGEGLGQNGKMGSGMPGSSEQFAKLAAQQEALRRQMQALMEKLKNKGQNPGGDLANLMEETEKDLVNKQLTNETMRRQQEILTRLLESEKAEKEREQDEQRKSNEAKSENNSNPARFLEYKRLKEKEMELLNTVPPSLTPYYKEKVNQYFNSLNK